MKSNAPVVKLHELLKLSKICSY